MFGLEWLTIPVLLGLLSLLFTAAWRIYALYFSRSARGEAALEREKADRIRLEAERDRLQAENTRIDNEPPKSGPDLLDDFRDAWKGKR